MKYLIVLLALTACETVTHKQRVPVDAYIEKIKDGENTCYVYRRLSISCVKGN